MDSNVRSIQQQFWHHACSPFLTIRTTLQSSQAYKAHSHEALSIGLMLAGGTCLSIDDQQLVLTAGEVVLIAPNKVHACNPHQQQPRSYHMLYIDYDWCCQQLSCIVNDNVTRFDCVSLILPTSVQCRALFSAIAQLLATPSALNSEAVAKILRQILTEHCMPSSAADAEQQLVHQVKQRLLGKLDSPPTLKQIAVELDRTPESIIRQFKKLAGITPNAFLHNKRIEKAKWLLQNGIAIADAAIEVGYSDQSQLHRAFVHYTAATPRQYQQQKSIFDNN